MMKKVLIASALLASATSFAGGKGGTELAIASYSDIGVIAAIGIPLDIKFLSSNGLRTYGEVELGVGFGNDSLALGAELSGGLLFSLDRGLSIYGSLGPAVGMGNDTEFGLGAEVGLNLDVNRTSIFIEGGTHPASNYIAVGMQL
ncbi:MAG: hypothetical protein P8X74_06145 [Reinekea sp.]|jgi:hypothetical protein